MKQRRAFTLAEVLITLGVIGVVAALTIPVVINFAFERESVSKAKETYSMLTQAVAQWQAEEGCVGETTKCPQVGPMVWPGGAYPHNQRAVATELAKYLKIADTGGDVGNWPIVVTNSVKDWMPDESYGLDGSKCGVGCSDYDTGLFINKVSAEYNSGSYFLLQNGVIISVSGLNWKYNIIFDTNGKKKPNRLGRDVFVMSLYSPNHSTANPYNTNAGAGWNPFHGICVDTAVVQCNAEDGASPLAYVLAHDKLPDLKAMGYPLAP